VPDYVKKYRLEQTPGTKEYEARQKEIKLEEIKKEQEKLEKEKQKLSQMEEKYDMDNEELKSFYKK